MLVKIMFQKGRARLEQYEFHGAQSSSRVSRVHTPENSQIPQHFKPVTTDEVHTPENSHLPHEFMPATPELHPGPKWLQQSPHSPCLNGKKLNSQHNFPDNIIVTSGLPFKRPTLTAELVEFSPQKTQRIC